MAPKRALQNIFGTQKWAIFEISPPLLKVGGLSPTPTPCSATPAFDLLHACQRVGLWVTIPWLPGD